MKVEGLIRGLGLKVEGLGFRVYEGLGFRVEGCRGFRAARRASIAKLQLKTCRAAN